MTRTIAPLATQRLASWHSRRPSFALMGEYSSGKSALLNVLLGKRLLPTKVTATDLPVIWITAGPQDKMEAMAYDGTLHELGLDALTGEAVMDYLVIRIETSAEILEHSDIIDTPGISDPRMTTATVEEIAKFTDFVIWCSPSNQAWRQTEKAFWTSLPQPLTTHSILALTRADKMRSAEDVEKVLRRCRSEAGSRFSTILPLSTPLAMLAHETQDPATALHQWKASGAEALFEHIASSVKAAAAACALRPDLPDPVETPSPAQQDSKKRRKQSKADPKVTTLAEISAAISELRTVAADSSRKERILATIRHLLSKIEVEEGLTDKHRAVLCRSLTVGNTDDVDMPRVVRQVSHEMADFSKSDWCELGDQA